LEGPDGDELSAVNEDTVPTLRARLRQTEQEAASRQRQLERYAADLREVFKQERARAQELRRSYRATVRALSNAVEARDAYTGKHAERVTAYGMELARAVGLSIEESPQIEFGFLLHDIGKVAVPDAILFKTSKLTEKEYALIAQHPVVGAEILRDVDFIGEGKLVVRHHHERWDGTGYPDGLSGEEIPLAARVFAVADTLDALTTDRPYRPASDWIQARAEIRRFAGTRSGGDRRVRVDPGRGLRRAQGRAVTRTILIVDDDPMIRKLIATTLEDISGYRLQEAGDGLEAIERAVTARPEIVFLDIDMPRLNGIEACRRLRSDPATAEATIVMLTGDSGDIAERGAQDAGADLFLTKPFSPLHLLRLVDRIGATR
jgi:putative nucleotidyltransferase with HDIG domain